MTLKWESKADWDNAKSDTNTAHPNDTVESATTTTTVDSFEDGDIAEYSGNTGGFSVTSSSSAPDGSYILNCDTSGSEIIGSFADTPSAGDTFSVNTRFSGVSGSRNWVVKFGYQDSSNYYDIYSTTGELGFRVTSGGATSTLASTTYSPTGGEWYDLQVDWGSGGSFTIDLYDSTGTKVASLSASDSSYTSGDIGFTSGGADMQQTSFDAFSSKSTTGSLTTATKSFDTSTAPDLTHLAYSGSPTVTIRGSPSGTTESHSVTLSGESEVGINWSSGHTEFDIQLDLGKNDSLTQIVAEDTATLTWETATDWDNAKSESNVEHPSGKVSLAETTVDSYEDADIAEYSGNTGYYSANTSNVQDGSYSLSYTGSGTTSMYEIISTSGLANYPSAGDNFEYQFYADNNNADAQFNFFAQDTSNYYTIKTKPNGDFRLYVKSGGGYTSLDAVTGSSISQNEWYRVLVKTDTSGNLTVELYDSTDTLLHTLSATDTTYTSGGIGFRTGSNGGGAVWDNIYIKGGSSTGSLTTATKSYSYGLMPDLNNLDYSGTPTLTVTGSPSGTAESHTITLDGSSQYAISWSESHTNYEVTLDFDSSNQSINSINLTAHTAPVVTSTSTTTDSVKLGWDAVPADSFEIERKAVDETSWTVLDQVDSSTTSYKDDSSLTFGYKYTYRVTAERSSNPSSTDKRVILTDVPAPNFRAIGTKRETYVMATMPYDHWRISTETRDPNGNVLYTGGDDRFETQAGDYPLFTQHTFEAYSETAHNSVTVTESAVIGGATADSIDSKDLRGFDYVLDSGVTDGSGGDPDDMSTVQLAYGTKYDKRDVRAFDATLPEPVISGHGTALAVEASGEVGGSVSTGDSFNISYGQPIMFESWMKSDTGDDLPMPPKVKANVSFDIDNKEILSLDQMSYQSFTSSGCKVDTVILDSNIDSTGHVSVDMELTYHCGEGSNDPDPNDPPSEVRSQTMLQPPVEKGKNGTVTNFQVQTQHNGGSGASSGGGGWGDGSHHSGHLQVEGLAMRCGIRGKTCMPSSTTSTTHSDTLECPMTLEASSASKVTAKVLFDPNVVQIDAVRGDIGDWTVSSSTIDNTNGVLDFTVSGSSYGFGIYADNRSIAEIDYHTTTSVSAGTEAFIHFDDPNCHAYRSDGTEITFGAWKQGVGRIGRMNWGGHNLHVANGITVPSEGVSFGETATLPVESAAGSDVAEFHYEMPIDSYLEVDDVRGVDLNVDYWRVSEEEYTKDNGDTYVTQALVVHGSVGTAVTDPTLFEMDVRPPLYENDPSRMENPKDGFPLDPEIPPTELRDGSGNAIPLDCNSSGTLKVNGNTDRPAPKNGGSGGDGDGFEIPEVGVAYFPIVFPFNYSVGNVDLDRLRQSDVRVEASSETNPDIYAEITDYIEDTSGTNGDTLRIRGLVFIPQADPQEYPITYDLALFIGGKMVEGLQLTDDVASGNKSGTVFNWVRRGTGF